jgi:hypothetical protein
VCWGAPGKFTKQEAVGLSHLRGAYRAIGNIRIPGSMAELPPER